jgi:hypothetical protein
VTGYVIAFIMSEVGTDGYPGLSSIPAVIAPRRRLLVGLGPGVDVRPGVALCRSRAQHLGRTGAG